QASMEAGERWMLNDVAGKTIFARGKRKHQIPTADDPLRSPKDSFLRGGAGVELGGGRTPLGENPPEPAGPQIARGGGQGVRQGGRITSDDYDFKGNLLHSQRQLARQYKATLDWLVPADVLLEPEVYTSSSRFDALNRPTELTTPHTPTMQPSVIHPSFN